MKAVFGPVPSRRLGQSLGVDLIPSKTCNWNCVYCQLGRSAPMVNVREEYVPGEDIVAQVRDALAAHRPGEIDWITFVGSGEPTLHSRIGWMVREIKTFTEIPVAVITNGSLLYLPEVRAELAAADAVMPTLDAGNAALYRKINRPWAALTFERLVSGLKAFRREYAGRLWPEIMLIKGLNDDERALREIAAILAEIEPDAVHINLPTRPPVEPWVQPPDEEALLRVEAILGDVAQIVHPVDGVFDLSGYESANDAIVGIVTRHPMREDVLLQTLARWEPDEIDAALQRLEEDGRLQVVERYGVRFWMVSTARFPDRPNRG